MSNNDIAIKVENISKCYRIGLKENMRDSLIKNVFHSIIAPVKNYRKYRSLYNFGELNHNDNIDNSDIIWALRDVSFEVREGEIVGVIGINGAGKSTLLKILARITHPTNGSAKIHGRISSLLEVGTGFHPELSGRENVYLNGSILGMRKLEIDRKFDQIVDFSGVEKFIDTPVKRYSSGMRVRLAFSVAAHLEPEILLVDEVLAVGDIQFQKKCLNKMEDVSQLGRTILFVSHNMPAVIQLCPRTILLNNGGVMMDGPSYKIVSAYMGTDTGTRAQHHWPQEEAPGDAVVRLCSIRVRTEEGNISEAIDIRESINIETEYEILEPGHTAYVYIHLVNEDGVDLFQSFDNDPEWKDRPRPRGRYNSTVQIPGNLLAGGIYYVTSSLRTNKPDIRRFQARDAVAFQVIDSMDNDIVPSEYLAKISGVIRPQLKWNTQVNADEKQMDI